MVGEGGQGSQTCPSGVAPERTQITTGAGTVRGNNFMHFPIQARYATGRGVNGHGCCGTRQNSRTWRSRWVISSCVGAVSTGARHGFPDVRGEISIETQRVRSREMVAPVDATDSTLPRSCRRIPKIRPVQLRTSGQLDASACCPLAQRTRPKCP